MFIKITGQISTTPSENFASVVKEKIDRFIKCNHCFYNSNFTVTPGDDDLKLNGVIECTELEDADYVKQSFEKFIEKEFGVSVTITATESHEQPAQA